VKILKSLILFCCCTSLSAQTYKNPVLLADYSDPDVIRDGNDYYLIASSFHFVPGIPILHSKDLVHWELSGHVVQRLNFSPAYDMVGGNRYAGGIWAPSVRFHQGLFYVYFPTPAEGIFVSTAPKMTGPWTEPVAVIAGPGFEDPCPFWDDDGKAWLVHSRLGAGPLILHRMAEDGKSVLDAGRVIVQDPKALPTLEGPKFYKRNGWYYIFAPMGGVGEGSQAVLRARNIEGPYEHRIVLSQGDTKINGPHQGGYVETPDGRAWFLHFQLRGAQGRIVHLEPVVWKDDWPIIGNVGEPVSEGPLPVAISGAAKMKPQTSDDFNAPTLSPMWEWNHNPEDTLWSLKEHKGYLRMHPGYAFDLMHARNTLTEVMQDEALDFTVRMDARHMKDGDHAGISLFDRSLSSLAVVQKAEGKQLIFTSMGHETPGPPISTGTIELSLRFNGDTVSYFYSVNEGKTFLPLGTPVRMAFSWWKGARPAIFSYTTDSQPHPNHFVDIDWAHYTAQ
jgi:beta-xylosidase